MTTIYTDDNGRPIQLVCQQCGAEQYAYQGDKPLEACRICGTEIASEGDTKTVKVRMTAFGDGSEVREVTVPAERITGDDLDAYADLDEVFYFGQNDHAIGPEKNTTPSVSIGDVIERPSGGLVLVCRAGFRDISDDEYAEWLTVPARDKTYHPMTTQGD